MIRPILVGLASLCLAGRAVAYTASPSAEQIQAAAAEGKRLALPHEGYPSRDYVLLEAKDVLSLAPENGDVDAVVLGTPLERTRHAAFLHAYADEAVDPTRARMETKLPDGWVEIIIFAHSNTRKDEDFLDHFTPAILELGGVKITPSKTEKSDADLDVYPRAPKDAMRYIATVTYQYDLNKLPEIGKQKGDVIFDDASGKHFVIPLDLAHFN